MGKILFFVENLISPRHRVVHVDGSGFINENSRWLFRASAERRADALRNMSETVEVSGSIKVQPA